MGSSSSSSSAVIVSGPVIVQASIISNATDTCTRDRTLKLDGQVNTLRPYAAWLWVEKVNVTIITAAEAPNAAGTSLSFKFNVPSLVKDTKKDDYLYIDLVQEQEE